MSSSYGLLVVEQEYKLSYSKTMLESLQCGTSFKVSWNTNSHHQHSFDAPGPCVDPPACRTPSRTLEFAFAKLATTFVALSPMWPRQLLIHLLLRANYSVVQKLKLSRAWWSGVSTTSSMYSWFGRSFGIIVSSISHSKSFF